MFHSTIIEDEIVATKKVISYSIWGNQSIYLGGLLRQAKFIINDSYFHDWECWIYYDNSLTADYIQQLQLIHPTRIRLLNLQNKYDFPYWNRIQYMWRFLPIDDPEVFIMICRDADSIITEREKNAIQVWLKLGKQFHIMRDHPHHKSFIMAGMWGMRKFGSLNRTWSQNSMESSLINWLNQRYNHHNPCQLYGIDESFLYEVIYHNTINDRIIHDEITRHEGNECIAYPSPWENLRFIGEKVWENSEPFMSFHQLLLPYYRKQLEVPCRLCP
jgi:protein O-GlcNAc transferase